MEWHTLESGLAAGAGDTAYTRGMARHEHAWDASYEFGGITYRECAAPDCRSHQQWVCALDRWSDTFATPSPRQREAQRQQERQAPSDR